MENKKTKLTISGNIKKPIKNIELASVTSPTDTTADGGGITLKGATNKTINWYINSKQYKRYK